MNYTIEQTFRELKRNAFSTRNFYMNEYYSTKWETKKICLKIASIFDRYTKWIYDIELNNENCTKYINNILKAYSKIEKYRNLLTY